MSNAASALTLTTARATLFAAQNANVNARNVYKAAEAAYEYALVQMVTAELAVNAAYHADEDAR